MARSSLTRNSIFNVMYQGVNVLFPLISAMYVSRILLADGVGAVASAQNIVLYFTLIASLGIPTYGVKKIAQARDDQNSLNRVFSELLVLNAVSTAVCVVSYYAIILTIDYFETRIVLYSVVGLNLVFNVFNMDWFYQGLEEYRYITLRNCVIKILSLMCLFLFVRTHEDILIYALISSLGLVSNYIYNAIHSRIFARVTLSGINPKQHLKPVFLLFAASVAIEVYTLLDTTMLAVMHGDEIVGYYVTATKAERIIKNTIVAVCAVLMPRLSQYYSEGKKKEFCELSYRGIRIIVALSIPAALGLAILSPVLIPALFGDDFYGAVATSQILSVSIVTVAMSNYVGYQMLVTSNHEKIVLASTILGAVVNVVLNMLLIPLFYHNGAAVASAVTECIVLVVQMIVVRRLFGPFFNLRFIVTTIAAAVITGLFIAGTLSLVHESACAIAISCIVGVPLYFLSGRIFRNEVCTLICRKIMKFVKAR